MSYPWRLPRCQSGWTNNFPEGKNHIYCSRRRKGAVSSRVTLVADKRSTAKWGWLRWLNCRLTPQTWWGGCPGWCSRTWGTQDAAAPLCTSDCKTYISDRGSEGLWRRCSVIQNKNLVPVLHRTNVVIHHSHGVPVRQETRHHLQVPTLIPVTDTHAASVDSHNPYSRDGEGRKADRQDDPGGHWAGEELPLSQAWGDTGASGRRHDRRQRDRETGWGVGVTDTKGDTLGWTWEEKHRGQCHNLSAPQDLQHNRERTWLYHWGGAIKEKAYGHQEKIFPVVSTHVLFFFFY